MVTESRSYKASFKDVYDASLEALKKCGLIVKERKESSIKATSDLSLLSWGESVEVFIKREREGVKVEVSSAPVAQLFDWGKSSENVSRVFLNIESELSKRQKR